MSELPIDFQARERFAAEWRKNFAVSANAGSGKTTAISHRLAAMALARDGGAEVLARTAVVTYTQKAAAQIGARARAVLLKELHKAGRNDVAPLEQLERAFFGTIHGFCLQLAKRYGQALGINLNPELVAEDDEAFWEDFLEAKPMQFHALAAEQVALFLRFMRLPDIFPLAQTLSAEAAKHLLGQKPRASLPEPDAAVLRQILDLPLKGTEKTKENVRSAQKAAEKWVNDFSRGSGFLPLLKVKVGGEKIIELCEAFMTPFKTWLASAASVLTAELALRYRAYRLERGVQTFADQIEAALKLAQHAETLDRIRAEGWRIILDEAQDTDPQQFSVLVEIARPVGAEIGAWPEGGGAPPRAGHFCLVGDGQQSIYGSRADIRNFRRHLEAFRRGDGGELLEFSVTFRTPRAVVEWLNAGLVEAFGEGRAYNWGLPPGEDAPKPFLQVTYQPLVAAPGSREGLVRRVPLVTPADLPKKVDAWLVEEARQLAAFLKETGPRGLGAETWSGVCVLAPRNEWLRVTARELAKAGLKISLQSKKSQRRDQPVYAWVSGLLAVVCDPENTFEWSGVLREVFGISDTTLAAELVARERFIWEQPDQHGAAVAAALETLRPWIQAVDDEGGVTGEFVRGLIGACALAEKAAVIDASGACAAECARLIEAAKEFGQDGGDVRAWLAELLAKREEGAASGAAEEDALNLLTVHSAKGLEWPVVIVIGLWRFIGTMPETGLLVYATGGGAHRVFLDGGSVPEEMKAARERERVRELVRLMYVALTRAEHALWLSWGDFGYNRGKGESFATLMGAAGRLGELSGEPVAWAIGAEKMELEEDATAEGEDKDAGARSLVACKQAPTFGELPARVLPHQLGEEHGRVTEEEGVLKRARTVAPLDDAASERAKLYGVWWHETVERWPWGAAAGDVAAYVARALAQAELLGVAERGGVELARFQGSALVRELAGDEWRREAELPLLAEHVVGESWIDGMVDLVAVDEARRALLVVDWKTNQRRMGETDAALHGRLLELYRGQLGAYLRGLAQVFPGFTLRGVLYSTVTGGVAVVEDGR